MVAKRTSVLIVLQILLVNLAAIGVVSATGEPTTSITIQTPYSGNLSDGGYVFVGQNPNFSLTAISSGNSTILYTEYEVTSSGNTTLATYTNPVTLWANYSTTMSLRYRSNSTTGLEGWNSLSLSVDADDPELGITSSGGNPLRFISNQSIYVTSTTIPLIISCTDEGSGVDTISGVIGQSTLTGTNGVMSLSPSNLPSGINGTSSFNIAVSCSDEVDNYENRTLTVIVDDSTPTLATNENGVRVGQCISDNWWLSVQSSDAHSVSNVEKLNTSGIWEEVNGSVGVPNSFNGTVTIRATDEAGHVSLNSTWNVSVDSIPPSLTASFNGTSLSVNSSDFCGVGSTRVRWEILTGTMSGWVTLQGSTLSIPSSLNGSIVRAQIQSTDVVGNTASMITTWVNTNGSSPYTSVFVLTDRVGSVLSPNVSFLLTPVGYQAVANWTLLSNNQSVGSGNTSTQVIVSDTFAHGDWVELFINTTDGLGDGSGHIWAWAVDGSNSHQIVVSVSGTYINTSGLIVGPSGRLSPASPSDDAAGVGASHALCTWDGSIWFNASSGSQFTPTAAAGTTQSFVFGCRSVDLLANEGPITWLNGSVDQESPIITLQPSAGETIGPSSVVTVNMSDANGISSGYLTAYWTNGTASSWSNTSLGSINWSASINQLFSNPADGTITINVLGVDSLGNSASLLGRTWTLNTSQPFISVTLSGDVHGTFISPNGSQMTLRTPSGGWSGIWINYTLTNNSGGEVMSANVSSTTILEPTSLPPGLVWLNTTIGDSLGRSQDQWWIFTVDDQNLQAPILDIVGSNTTINNSSWIGPGAKFRVHGVNDDPSGVGPRHALCSWDGSAWFTAGENSQLSPSVSSGAHQAISLRCQSVDLLSNAGPLTWINVTADHRAPAQTLSPASSQVISPDTQITVNVSDTAGIAQSVLVLFWTNGQNTWTQNVTIATTTWSSTLSALRTGFVDGSVSATLRTWDVLGNEAVTSGWLWTLNTTQPLSTVSMTGSAYGNYVSSTGFTIHLTPPTSGGYGGWAVYSLNHSNGTTIASGNATTNVQMTPTSLPSGQIWLNVSSYDAFSRTQSRSWMYHVDTGVGTLPLFGLQGAYQNQSGNPILGPSGRLRFVSLQDDVGGVGASHATCSWNGQDWFNVGQTSTLSPQSSSGSIQSFSLGCSVVDLLNNVGGIRWLNGTVDVQSPSVTLGIGIGSLLSDNSTFNVSCSDSAGCNLVGIDARFNIGSSTTWHSISLSGSSSGVVLSTLLNVTGSGTITFFMRADDLLDNSINQSSSNFQYLHGPPTVSLTITSNHSGSYIDGNLSFLVTPSIGWHSGISVNLTVEHSANASRLFDGVLNQSNSSQTYLDLSEGQLWSNSTICDALSRCSSTSVHLYVDLTGPSAPLYSITDGYLLANQSRIVHGGATVVVSRGLDSGSGVSQTVCTGSNGQVTFSTQQVSLYIQSLVSPGVWSDVQCSSLDSVGNGGGQVQFTIRRDDSSPLISLSDGSNSAVIAPSNWYNATCTDDVLRNLLSLEVESNGTVVYQMNTTGDISIRYGTISTLGAGGYLTFILNCSDVAGNHETDSRVLEWLPSLDASSISVSGVISGGSHYVATTQTVSLSNPRSDVYHEVRYIVNGTSGSWERMNSISFSLNELNSATFVHGASLRIETRVLKDGCTLTNSSISTLMFIDLSGPSLSLVSNPVLSNGSVINLSSQDVGVGLSHHVWSWDNGTVQQSSSLSDVRLSTSSSSSSWLSIRSIDRLGNAGNWVNDSISRDLSPPAITVVSSHPGYLGPNSTFDVEITESTGLDWSTLRLYAPNGQVSIIANNTSSYRVSASNLPNWVWNHATVSLVIQAESSSELLSVFNLTLIPDMLPPTISVDTSRSSFLYGLNTSNNTALYFSTPSDTAQFCVKVGNNETVASAGECLIPTDSAYRHQRQSGPYVVVMNVTDHAGNNRVTILNLDHHTISPQIADTIPSILRPGTSQAYNYSSALPATTSIYWDASSVLDQGGWFTVPAGTGTHNLTLNVTDATGLTSERSWSVILDGIAPSISLQGDFYAGTIIGTDTLLYINSSDALSLVSTVNLTVSSGVYSCSSEWQPISASFSINGTLSDLFFPNACTILQTNSVNIILTLTVEDSLGNLDSDSSSMQYYGGISQPTWISANVVIASSSIWVSEHSTFTCNEPVGTIEPSIELNWTGSGGIITDSNVSNVTSSGVLICNVIDAFGNSAMSSLNLSFDSSGPTFSVSWPIGSNGFYVRAAGPPFLINSSDGESGIASMTYCITESSCSPTTLTSGVISLDSGNGTRQLYIQVMNGVGLRTLYNVSYIQDNTPPSITIDTRNNLVIRNSAIFVGSLNPSMGILIVDNVCIVGGNLYWNNGNITIDANSNHTVPSGATWLRIDATDCVGHLTSHNYSVQSVYSISSPVLSIHPAHNGTGFIRQGVLIHDGSIVLRLNPSHPVPLQVSCIGSSSSVSVNCDIPGLSNVFDVYLFSTDWQGSFQMSFSDELGNSMNQSIFISADLSDVICTPLQHVLENLGVFTIPASRSTVFSCIDNLAGVRSVSWVTSNSTVSWTHVQNDTWSAPPPSGNSLMLVTEDEVGNTFSRNLIIIYDDTPPTLNFTAISGLSFDEAVARPDGRFEVICVDVHSSPCTITVTQQNISSGPAYEVQTLYNTGNVSLANPPLNITLRIDFNVEDAIGNIRSVSRMLYIDATPPIIELTARSPQTSEPLPSGIIADDGIITIDNLMGSDVNYSLSQVILTCLTLPTTSYTESLQSLYDLNDYELGDCDELKFEVYAVDHVSNANYDQWHFSIDRIHPSVTYTPDENCFWDAGEHIDMQSACGITIEMNDDESVDLSSEFQVQIRIVGDTNYETKSLNQVLLLDLTDYTNQIVLISVTGSDRTQRRVSDNTLRVQVRDELIPIWAGLICAGSVNCGWSDQIVAAHIEDNIGVATFPGQAPIITSSFVFQNALVNYEFTSVNFSAIAIPDGTYMLTPEFTDAAGRVFNPGQFTFIYDNQAPVIQILETQSTGIRSNSTVLSCDVCKLVWRVHDTTDSPSTTNHGSYPQVLGQYSMSTATLGNHQIQITATDAFGRTSMIEFNTIHVNSTTLDPVETLVTENDVSLLCMESVAIDEVRQVTCLWHRSGSVVDYIPIHVEANIDQRHLRDVNLVIEKSGGRVEVIELESGHLTLPGIPHYTSSFVLYIMDNFSEVNSIHYVLIEHTLPWSNLSLDTPQLSEDFYNSTFEVIIYAPFNEGEFHILKRGQVELEELLNCSSEYVFAQHDDYSVTTEVINCNIIEWRIRADGSLLIEVFIDHQGVRDSLGLSNHLTPLFNLQQFTIFFVYEDLLGVIARSTSDDVTLGGGEIIRTVDSHPTLIPSFRCPLGLNSIEFGSDGFLQSDGTAPLGECSDSILDSDGIDHIIWNITFESGTEKYSIEIECKSTFFPQDWNLREAIDSDQCEYPSNTFPTGVFDVTIRPWVVDESVFMRSPDDFRTSSDGSHSKMVQFSECQGNNPCPFVEYFLIDVVVSSSLDPAMDVENSRMFVATAQEFITSEIFWALLVLLSLILIGAILSLIVKVQRKATSMSIIEPDSTGDREDEHPELNIVDFKWKIIADDGEIHITGSDVEYKANEKVLDEILGEFGIHDRDGFLVHALKYDSLELGGDDNNYLSKVEMEMAAEAWNETSTDAASSEPIVDDYDWSEDVLSKILKKHDIGDRDAFLEHAMAFDEDGNLCLKKSELEKAAEAFEEPVEIEADETDEQFEVEAEDEAAEEPDEDEDDDDVAPIGSNVGISLSEVKERVRQLQEKAARADESDD